MSNDLTRRSAGANDRDRILDQALRRELSADVPPVTPQCLDAETLAAWEDGGLDAAAMETAEVHVSTCARCQSVLGAMAKATPAIVAVAESKSIFSWHWWFAPLAAGAAAVTLWMVVPEEQQQLATAPPAAVAPARDADRQQPAKPAGAPTRPAQNAVPSDKAQEALQDRVSAPTASPGERDDRRERQTTATEKKEEAGKVVADQPAAVADAVAPARAAENAPFAPTAPAAAGALQMRARAPVAPVEIASADGLRRWRVVATGVEYSMDRGATWVPVRAVGTEIITGGVAVSGSICWLIGKAGVVLVTVDGMTFAKVDLPVRVDVASITATDARSAVATTADGRTFRTGDSGRNWRQN